MDKENLMLFGLVAALAVIVLWNKAIQPEQTLESGPASDLQQSNIQTPSNTASGPNYLTYNQPYAFTAPVQNIMGPVSGGELGIPADQLNPLSCGCNATT